MHDKISKDKEKVGANFQSSDEDELASPPPAASLKHLINMINKKFDMNILQSIYLFFRRRRFCFSSSSLSLLLETSLSPTGADDAPTNDTAFVPGPKFDDVEGA